MPCMWFYTRAWTAAAEQYGKDRAEKYGRIAKIVRAFYVLACLALILGIVHLWNLGQAGE